MIALDTLEPAGLHPALVAAVRAVALSNDQLFHLQQEALRLAPMVTGGSIKKSDAIDALVGAGVERGIARGEAEHVVGMGLQGQSAGVGLVPGLVGKDWPKPDRRLVDGDRPPPPQLDDDLLPAGWSPWISAEAEARACPRDYVAAGLIGAASAWIGNARRVAETADWIEPAQVWIALIGPPSAGKTPALRPVIDASRWLEREEEPAWREALDLYERDAEKARTLDKAWRESVATAEGADVPERPIGAQKPV